MPSKNGRRLNVGVHTLTNGSSPNGACFPARERLPLPFFPICKMQHSLALDLLSNAPPSFQYICNRQNCGYSNSRRNRGIIITREPYVSGGNHHRSEYKQSRTPCSFKHFHFGNLPVVDYEPQSHCVQTTQRLEYCLEKCKWDTPEPAPHPDSPREWPTKSNGGRADMTEQGVHQ